MCCFIEKDEMLPHEEAFYTTEYYVLFTSHSKNLQNCLELNFRWYRYSAFLACMNSWVQCSASCKSGVVAHTYKSFTWEWES